MEKITKTEILISLAPTEGMPIIIIDEMSKTNPSELYGDVNFQAIAHVLAPKDLGLRMSDGAVVTFRAHPSCPDKMILVTAGKAIDFMTLNCNIDNDAEILRQWKSISGE